jgi:hypothetical protein
MPEPRRDQPLDGDVLVAVSAPPGEHRFGFEVADPICDCPVMGLGDGGADRRVGV